MRVFARDINSTTVKEHDRVAELQKLVFDDSGHTKEMRAHITELEDELKEARNVDNNALRVANARVEEIQVAFNDLESDCSDARAAIADPQEAGVAVDEGSGSGNEYDDNAFVEPNTELCADLDVLVDDQKKQIRSLEEQLMMCGAEVLPTNAPTDDPDNGADDLNYCRHQLTAQAAALSECKGQVTALEAEPVPVAGGCDEATNDVLQRSKDNQASMENKVEAIESQVNTFLEQLDEANKQLANAHEEIKRLQEEKKKCDAMNLMNAAKPCPGKQVELEGCQKEKEILIGQKLGLQKQIMDIQQKQHNTGLVART